MKKRWRAEIGVKSEHQPVLRPAYWSSIVMYFLKLIQYQELSAQKDASDFEESAAYNLTLQGVVK